MKNKAILFIFFLLPFTLFAQIDINDSTEIKNSLYQQLTGEKYLDQGKGSINLYFINNWCFGKLVLASGDVIKRIPIRYNCSIGQLIWLNTNIGQIRLDNQNISEFYLTSFGTNYHFRKIKTKLVNDSAEIFAQELFENKLKLFVYRKVELGTKILELDGIYYLYTQKPIYIININKKQFFCHKAKIKSLIEIFPQAKEKINQRIKQNHLKCKTEQDFINIIKNVEDILLEAV